MTALLVFATYQTFENHVIQPLIGSRVVHVPPLVLLIGALFGVRWRASSARFWRARFSAWRRSL